MAHLFDWLEYLALAKASITSTDEAVLRSAISRAYYAAFNQAKAYCVAHGTYIERTTDSHQAVWNTFLGKGNTYRAVQHNGDLLKLKRVKADYKADPIPRLQDVVKQAVHECELVLNYLSQLPPPPSPPATH